MSSLTLKVGFPPGHPAAHSMIKVEPNVSCGETLRSIVQKQNINNPEQYLLYIPGPPSTWMDNNALISAYPALKAGGLIELKKKHQMVRITGKSTTHTLLLDVTIPLKEFMKWVAVKFLIDEGDLANWALFNKGVELNPEKSVTYQCAESTLQFSLVKRGETSLDTSLEENSNHFSQEDDEGVSLQVNSKPVDRDSGSENEDHDLQVPAKSLVNPTMEGWLKKLTTKKDWKKRYFVLKDKNLYYYSSPQDRKAHGVISLLNYAAKPTTLQAKEAKYWAFELYTLKPPKSPRKDSKESDRSHGLILRCENEQEMHAWLAAIRGDSTPKLIAYTPDKRHRSKTMPSPAVFGVDLSKSVPFGAEIPNIVEQAIKYIDEKALDTVGIYRLSGAAPTILNWKKAFDRGDRVDLSLEPDPHAVAGLLKLFLRELPEPILTFEKYESFVSAMSRPNKWAKVKAVREVAATLIGANKTILLTLLQHLRRVNEKCEINKMHLANLATVFGPTLLRKPSSNLSLDGSTGFDATVLTMVVDTPVINELCMSMIEDYEYIFGDKPIPHGAIFARALYAYKGEDLNTELSFESGTIIRVTQGGQKDQWWMGQILLSPTSSFIGKAGCFPGSYVEEIPGTSPDWVSLSMLYTLTEEVENNRGQLLELQSKLDSAVKMNAAAQVDKEDAAFKGEHKQQAIAEAVGINPSLARLWEHMDDLVHNLTLYSKTSTSLETDQHRHTVLEDLEQLSNSKFKGKAEKEGYAAKLEALRASLEAEKASRAKLSLTTSIVLKDIDFLKNMLR